MFLLVYKQMANFFNCRKILGRNKNKKIVSKGLTETIFKIYIEKIINQIILNGKAIS
jgi:hypothetical protein